MASSADQPSRSEARPNSPLDEDPSKINPSLVISMICICVLLSSSVIVYRIFNMRRAAHLRALAASVLASAQVVFISEYWKKEKIFILDYRRQVPFDPPAEMRRVSEFQYKRIHEANASQTSRSPDISVSQSADSSTFSEPEVLISSDLAAAAREDNMSCIVCWAGRRDSVLLECGHGGVCVACAGVLWRQGRRCPLCRARFCGVVRILRGESDTVRGSRVSLASRDSFAAIFLPRAPPLLPAVGKEGRGGRTSELQEGGSQRCTETPGSEDGDVTARVGGVAACRQEGMPPKLT